MNIISNAFAQQRQPPAKLEDHYYFANPVYGFSDLGKFVEVVTPLVFSISAMLVVFYFIIGAFELITSQGDKAHIVSARSKIYHSIIGFVLLMALFLVMQYLLPALGVTGLNIF